MDLAQVMFAKTAWWCNILYQNSCDTAHATTV